MQRNHYQVLGVRADASHPEIRSAFVRLTKLHHPDSAGDRALAWRLQDVQTAYRCLSIAETRAAHDAELAEAERAHFAKARTVQRRLDRYDRRHPHAQPSPYRQKRWRKMLLVMVAVGALVMLGLIS